MYTSNFLSVCGACLCVFVGEMVYYAFYGMSNPAENGSL